jgi:diaminopimelate decarboxylase
VRDGSNDRILALAADALENKVPVLPLDELHAFIDSYLADTDTFLRTVKDHGSPLYVIDKQSLRNQAYRFSTAFRNALPTPVRVYYAIKSNSHPMVVDTFLQCGLGLDVSSGKELDQAVGLGATDIVFSGPGKTEDELSAAVAYADRVTVLMDSFAELGRLEAIAARRATSIKAGVRLTANPKGLWRKFGIPLSRLCEFLSVSESCSHVRLTGLQFHTSWNLDPRAQSDFIAELGMALRELPSSWISRLQFIDIGGGYWPERGEWLQAAGTTAGAIRNLLAPNSDARDGRHCLSGTPIEQFAQELSRAIREHLTVLGDFSVYLEPGRWLCNDGMHLLMTVVDRKAPDLVITDAGTNAVGWERFETDFFPVINLTRPAMKEMRCDVHGCLCTPHDIWGYSIWGQDVCPGDVLLIPCQGAYTYSLRQDFIKPLPSIAVV